jgi:DNA polymerase I-like protein with 3'-5' exonuclease and polymerase domains
MLVNVDAKALEWLVCAYLSKDKVAYQEIIDGVDQHSENQIRFGLPSRVIAKIFVFRLIYGGTEYSYANDPDFTGVSTSQKFWKGVIDEFYEKYYGVHKWHTSLIETVTSTGQLRMPTGRFYNYSPTVRGNDLEWPRTTILNYPVQGLGADLMCLARVSFARRFKAARIPGRIISTIHDSIVVDIPNEYLDQVARMFHAVFDDLPYNFKKMFGVEFDLPCRCEVSYGNNKKDLTEYVIS